MWMWDLVVSVPDHCLSFYNASGRTFVNMLSVGQPKNG